MKNQVLEALPARERKLLWMQISPVNLPRSMVLFDADDSPEYLYFPLDATISYLSSTAHGQSIQVGLVGNEGMVGIASLLSDFAAFRAVVQIPGSSLRIRRAVLKREFQRAEAVREVLLEYANALMIQVAQTAVCNKFHDVEARFCRWLLMAHDRCPSSSLAITHDSIARILGTRRASITIVAGNLQKAGAIRYTRGVIEILDRTTLEGRVCECYQMMVAAHDIF